MKYYVIYDGKCHLCVTFTQLLEKLDQGVQFYYTPMQETITLQQLGITPEECQLGVILINSTNLNERWQGSEALEKIIQLLPNGQVLITAYHQIPGLKKLGDNTYLQVRDHRYQWFGGRADPYYSSYTFTCDPQGNCHTKSTENFSQS